MFLLTGLCPGPILGVPPDWATVDGGIAMTRTPDRQPLAPGLTMRTTSVRPAAVSGHEQRLAVVTLPGEIDVTNDGQVQDMLARALDGGAAVLVADAGGTSVCGCAGVNALIDAQHRAAAAGAQLRVVASPAVRRILQLTGASDVLDTYPTLTAALAGQPDHRQATG